MEKRFDEVVQSTMNKYDGTFKKLAAGESQKPKKSQKTLYLCELEDIVAEVDESGLNGLSGVGVEIVDRNTGERLTYIANSAWANLEWDELTITVYVDSLPKIDE